MSLRSCRVHISSVSPYSSSRFTKEEFPEMEGEKPDAYDDRIWRRKLTTDANGIAVIPGSAFKQATDFAAKMVGGKIPGKGNSTYAKLFTTGVIVENDASLGVHANDVEKVRLYCHAQGVRGPGKRVWRNFPIVHTWSTVVDYLITDPDLPNEVFERVVTAAGRCAGVGRWRPENGGNNGRFNVTAFEWLEV